MEAVSIVGEVKNITNRSGQSNNGFWESVTLAIQEKVEQYPCGAVVTYFVKEICKNVKYVNEGDVVKATFNMKMAEYDDKYYTNCQGWKIEIISKAAPMSIPKPEQIQTTETTEEDDLPF